MLDQLSTYHSLPSHTVVVSGVFMGVVIFKMMKEGSMCPFDEHALYVKYNQEINSVLKGTEADLSFAALFYSHIISRTQLDISQSVYLVMTVSIN